jgi:hypothetical protein
VEIMNEIGLAQDPSIKILTLVGNVESQQRLTTACQQRTRTDFGMLWHPKESCHSYVSRQVIET